MSRNFLYHSSESGCKEHQEWTNDPTLTASALIRWACHSWFYFQTIRGFLSGVQLISVLDVHSDEIFDHIFFNSSRCSPVQLFGCLLALPIQECASQMIANMFDRTALAVQDHSGTELARTWFATPAAH